jgi:amino acid adenylation domain-containing protein
MTALLQHYLRAQAQRRPQTAALVDGARTLTFGELETASNRLAHALREAGCRGGDRVCICIPKSTTAIVATLAVLKIGGIYVPVDTLSPAARVRKILQACGCRLILAAGPVEGLLAELCGGAESAGERAAVAWLASANTRIGALGPRFTIDDVASQPAEAPPLEALPTAPALILFTSGSTGTPKGVVIRHESVWHVVEWARAYFGWNESDRLSQHAPLFFDISYLDLYGALSSGAQLHLVPRELNLLPHKLADFIRARELTQWFSVPSVLTHMANFDVLRPGDFPALRRVLWAGEVFRTPPLVYWMKRLPHARFTNLYGPTETTIVSSRYTVPSCPEQERAEIPIGQACAGEELLVLDEHLRPAPPGTTGELYIRGVGLASGYWNDEEKTQAAFVRDVFSDAPGARLYRTGDLARLGEDGQIYFCGRADTQIKSRGYRIELGEIESALATLDELREAAVVAVESAGFEGHLLCCAFVARETGPAGAAGAIRTRLATLVPAYMLPVRWMRLEALPRTASGKIDRVRLREEFLTNDAATA